ncbi:MAG: hypothetical protein RIR12_2208 [Bacteroidota bacterium]|jgi:plasmid stabilization system protein ParE
MSKPNYSITKLAENDLADTTIEIVRVLHERMDVPKHIKE